MEIICRQCEGNAFRILPENLGTVAAECVVCGTLTLIEIPKAAARSPSIRGLAPKDHRCHPANGHRHDGFASEVAASLTQRKSTIGMN